MSIFQAAEEDPLLQDDARKHFLLFFLGLQWLVKFGGEFFCVAAQDAGLWVGTREGLHVFLLRMRGVRRGGGEKEKK